MKHLIKNNQITRSEGSIPSKFTRENGESFWGGYQNRTDLHYEDGWRDEIMPEVDQFHQLGERYYDDENDVVTYTVIEKVIDLAELLQRRLARFEPF